MLSRGRTLRFFNVSLPLEERIIRYYSCVIPTLEAEEELKIRGQSAPLSPDRLYSLLVQVGVNESEAESSRAKYELQQLQRNTQWQK